MSQPFVSGPAEIHCGTGTSNALQFLGWGETGVRISLNSAWEDVMSDVAGSKIPYDVQFMAEEAYLTMDLTVWNEAVYTILAGRVIGQTRGAGSALTVGTLMGVESSTGAPPTAGTQGSVSGGGTKLMIFAPYSTLAQYATQPAAYTFGLTWLADATELEVGTKYKKVRCVFRAIPVFNQTNYTYTLYTSSTAGKGAVS